MDEAARTPKAVPARVSVLSASVAALLLVSGCALLAVVDGDRRYLVDPAVSTIGYVLIAVVFAVQIHSALRVGRHRAGNLLLAIQTVLTGLLLLVDAWLWHGTTGLLAGTALALLSARTGWLVAALVTVALLPVMALSALEPGQALHWLASHTALTLGICTLGKLTVMLGDLRREGRAAVLGARVRERARVAADLHDILGRALVAVALKSEILHWLARGQPELELESRELMSLAREARSQVRSAVAVPWRGTVTTELALARKLLRDTSVTLVSDTRPYTVGAEAETVLAAAVREAVTNTLVHSEATRLHVFLGWEGEHVVLRLRNDGADGGRVVFGAGLNGLARRLLSVGGRLSARTESGGHFVLTCCVPSEVADGVPLREGGVTVGNQIRARSRGRLERHRQKAARRVRRYP